MATETVEMDDKALFDAATADAPPAEVPAEQPQEAAPAEPEPKADDRPRDEHGRFAPKAEPAEVAKPQAEQTQQPDSGAQIPAWRVSEIAEARRAAEARAAENERRAQELERQNRHFQQQLQQLTKPAEEIDPYADPQKFRDQGVRQALDPVQQRMDALREHYSRKAAISEHGLETVQAAYKWLDEGSRTGDPRLGPVIQRAMTSIDPFDEIVTAYKRDRAATTVGDDPQKWFESQLAEAAKDPAKRQEILAKLSGAQQQQPSQSAQPNSTVRLPPSLTRAPGSSGNAETGSLADGDLYAFATR